MRGSTPLGPRSGLYWWIGYIGAYGSKINQFPPGYIDGKTHAILADIWHTQEINNQNNVVYLRFLAMHCEEGLVNKHKHTIYANSKFIQISNHDQTIYM